MQRQTQSGSTASLQALVADLSRPPRCPCGRPVVRDLTHSDRVLGAAAVVPAWVGVEADRLLEQVRESDSDAARAATSIEDPPATVEIQFLGENSLKLRRVGRSSPPVVRGGALIDRGVVWHDDRMPAEKSTATLRVIRERSAGNGCAPVEGPPCSQRPRRLHVRQLVPDRGEERHQGEASLRCRSGTRRKSRRVRPPSG